MKRLSSVLALALLAAAGFAAVAPLAPLVLGGRDLTRIPADPAVLEKDLAAKPVSLAKAIEVATKEGGVAAAASFGANGQIELTVYQGGAEHAVLVDGTSGLVVSKTARSRFSGEAVTGEGTTTASGLRYYDVRLGTGAEAVAGTSKVSVHYTGWLVDGTKFDSSVDRGQPFDFALSGGVIQGWLEGVAGMKEGGKRKLVIPANLGYGARGAGGVIPPNAVLVFDVELLKIK
ncbi:MAG: FKBP-type peptidyl-prolyl cis-trans isomerase [Planctomycetes bacterium]|jgi:FKBP-type peptidyl-prolyl cis-trans isomerase FkpA|nr:FKBP-type peptidyl-prolyl cis-trans isomerase [Planctomycetota bacterium]